MSALGIEGRWAGNLVFDNAIRFVVAEFGTDGSQLAGKLDGKELEHFHMDGTRVTFTLPDTKVEAKLDGDVLTGSATSADKSGTLALARIAAIDPAACDGFAGTYHISKDHVVSISHVGDYLFYYDSAKQQSGLLFPSSTNTFFAGPGRLMPLPVQIRVTFEDGGLVWEEEGQPEAHFAPKGSLDFYEEEVDFFSGNVRLAGTLRVPKGNGPHPAIVLLAGSGAQVRDGFRGLVRFYAEHFSRSGFATLIFDKRGTGHSDPADWENTSFDEFSNDALAALQYAQNHKDINADQVGFWGISQGTWIGELASQKAQNTDHPAAFLLLVSGGGVDGAVQETKRVELTMRADGYSEAAIQQAIALQHAKFRFAESRSNWGLFNVLVNRAKPEPWYELVSPPESADHPAWDWWHTNNINPLPILKALECPVFAILGTHDTLTPPIESQKGFDMVFRSTTAPRKIKIVDHADHVLFAVETGGADEAPRVKGFAEGVLDEMTRWMKSQVK